MSTIKPGDVMLTKSCRMVRVLASRDDGAVAMRDYRSRVAVRSVDTDRLSYHSEHELTLVQPPAPPQEPNVREDIGRHSAEIQRLGNAVRDGSATPEMAYAWLTHPYVCTSDMVKAAARIMASAPPAVWQPIETAPKDGTPVLLWWRDERDVEWWACGSWRQFGDGSRGWCGESFHASEEKSWTRLLGQHPTHWMPLPSPPTPGETR